jgi:MFS family permease
VSSALQKVQLDKVTDRGERAANAILYSIMVLTCTLGPLVANRVGLKNAMIFGTTGYALYAAALYTNNRFGNEWFVYLGATACGITAGVFWSAEGAIMISCKFIRENREWNIVLTGVDPPESQRGRYLAYWLAYRNASVPLTEPSFRLSKPD